MRSETLARDNHFVPVGLLKRWSPDGKQIFAYRTLVSNENVPLWGLRPLRGVAYRRNLYTVYSGGQERDDLEKEFSQRFETPAFEVIDRAVIRQGRLSRADRRKLGQFVAAQDVRTPLNWLESLDRFDEQLQDTLKAAVEEATALIQEAKRSGQPVELKPDPVGSEFSKSIRIELERDADPEAEGWFIRAELSADRQLWLAQMRFLLRPGGAARVLGEHWWSIVEPSGDLEWPLTDHPVLRLNYYRAGVYDFRGGWGRPGSEIILPLSPKHLLYTKVGAKSSRRIALSRAKTQEMQEIIAKRAHRWIFSTHAAEWVEQARPRQVNAELFSAEDASWERWHPEQLQSEMESDAVRPV